MIEDIVKIILPYETQPNWTKKGMELPLSKETAKELYKQLGTYFEEVEREVFETCIGEVPKKEKIEDITDISYILGEIQGLAQRAQKMILNHLNNP